MSDLRDQLHAWYESIETRDPDHDHLIATAVVDGRHVRRRRVRRMISSVSVACVVVTAIAIAIADRHAAPTRVVTTTPTTIRSSSTLPVATNHDFADLDRARAWLASAIAQDAQRPSLVHAEIVQTTMNELKRAQRPTNPASSAPDRPIYAVQLTGTTFACNNCGVPLAGSGTAMQVAWDPAIRFVADSNMGQPIDLTRLGRVYTLDIGRPTTPAPTGPQCGQSRGRATTITAVTRLDHTVQQLPEVFTPPGSAAPAITPEQALHGVAASTPGFLAPKVSATLAMLNTVGNALVKGPRLVWILSVTNVVVSPSIGFPGCGNAAVVIDATSNRSLVAFEGSVAF